MFAEEYARLVIKPKIDAVLMDGVESIGDLTTKFNKAFECRASRTRMAEWLKVLGYRLTRTVQIERPGAAPAPRLGEAEIVQVNEVKTVEFKTVHRQSTLDFPSPIGTFTNIPMPGFME